MNRKFILDTTDRDGAKLLEDNKVVIGVSYYSEMLIKGFFKGLDYVGVKYEVEHRFK